jgi:hypothetical protein
VDLDVYLCVDFGAHLGDALNVTWRVPARWNEVPLPPKLFQPRQASLAGVDRTYSN